MTSSRVMENTGGFLPREVHASGLDRHSYSRRHVRSFHCDFGSDLPLHVPFVVWNRHVEITCKQNMAAAKQPRVRKPRGEHNWNTIGIDQRRSGSLNKTAHRRPPSVAGRLSHNCNVVEAAALHYSVLSQLVTASSRVFGCIVLAREKFRVSLHQPTHCDLHGVETLKHRVSNSRVLARAARCFHKANARGLNQFQKRVRISNPLRKNVAASSRARSAELLCSMLPARNCVEVFP